MIGKIRNSKASKIIACYLALMMLLEIAAPMQAFALTEGPTQPEFSSFTPMGSSDMVNLTNGDFNYNIPIMDVGGYPINLAYDSGITMDQEASWVGLGWNLNVGQISRDVRGLPDDFKGDEVKTYNNMRKNITIGVNPYINFQLIGSMDAPTLGAGAGLNIQYNNYRGLSAVPSFGLSFNLCNSVSVGMQLSGSAEEGASITPNVGLSLSKEVTNADCTTNQLRLGISPSITYNSRQGLQSFNLSTSVNQGYEKDNGKKASANLRSGRGSVSFANKTFTPSKRLAFNNSNITLAFSGGPDVWGGHVEGSISASATIQSLKDRDVATKAFGYDFTQLAGTDDLLDFNREKDPAQISQNTLVLPVTNYTYDLYNVQGQGVSGQFRPYRGQVGYVFDSKVVDAAGSDSFGLEVEGGAGAHMGLNFKTNETNTYTGNWENNVQPYFNENFGYSPKEYESVYYKMVGELKTDVDGHNLLDNKLAGEVPITLALNSNDDISNKFAKKAVLSGQYQSTLTALPAFAGPIKRSTREKRNTTVQKISKNEAIKYGLYNNLVNVNVNAKGHHTAAFFITDESGNRHIFGETAYNITKEETSFAVGASSVNEADGTVNHVGSQTNSMGIDHYFSKTVTPAYAHTYLLTQLLSSDYEDLTGDGPTDDDLGSYTKFEYNDGLGYKWRTPYGAGKSSFNEGLKTIKGSKGDQKGSYVYGNKELKYLKRIVTKTHVAFIDLEERQDGYGVDSQYGGGSASTTSKMKRIKSIRLYSKPEVTNQYGIFDPLEGGPVVAPIKTAHFEYDYSLCGNVENNHFGGGKLTLKKVYFTYRNSNMGKYTPYHFNYTTTNNFSYNLKNYDVWGNYKPLRSDASFSDNNKKPSPQEFPYVNQSSSEVNAGYSNKKAQQDAYASAWSLSSIDLPSGGKIEITYETDDYKYVQNKRALRMFMVEGVSKDPNLTSLGQWGTNLYIGNDEAKYVAIKLDADDTDTNINNFRERYIGELINQPIYFNFLLNMTNSDYEFVEGYFEMDNTVEPAFVTSGSTKYIFIPMKYVNREGKHNSSTKNSNPISLAGWFFGRENLNREVNGGSSDYGDNMNIVNVAKGLVNNLGAMLEIFTGGNERLRNRNCAKSFKSKKSWVRLQEPTGIKMGGGARVKKILMYDQWNTMVGSSGERYSKEYGQEYDYSLEDGTSSGVATYEPNVCKENPLIKPFYHKPEKLSGKTYVEEPFGESFFPGATVTYSRVTVKNITAADNDGGLNSSKTKTGKVVTQHYTSYDFPTITDFTSLSIDGVSKSFKSNESTVTAAMSSLSSLLGLKIDIKTKLTLTQGFTIETNDMNGKVKKQEVYNNSDALISSVEYKYNTIPDQDASNEYSDTSKLSNLVPVIDDKGHVTEKNIGLEYDVINDFRESYSNTKSFGVSGNVDLIPFGFLPIIIGYGVPERAEHTQTLRTAVTTKVIHRTGILTETIAYDLGSRVSTKNLAWDAATGQVLLTQTINEFDDKYYTFSYPAYWYEKQMGQASENIDISGNLVGVNGGGSAVFGIQSQPGTSSVLPGVDKYLKIGDEVSVNINGYGTTLWVSDYYPPQSSSPDWVKLMKRDGTYQTMSGVGPETSFKVIRSGYINQQKASMASVTSMVNPIRNAGGNLVDITSDTFVYLSPSTSKRVLNASAILYSDNWTTQCECNLPDPLSTYNPFVGNVKNQWRPVKSYAYLTGRDIPASSNVNTRNTGFYDKFESAFYEYDETDAKWTIDTSSTGYNSWTFASMVSKYSPKGLEIENKDALNRYSSAQYGHNYTLPIAVASNSRYQDMGYQGFEDYTEEVMAHGIHFGLSNYITPSECFYEGHPNVVSDESHTGNMSLRVTGNEEHPIICYSSDTYVDNMRNCFSFKPTPGEYVISAWVKEDGAGEVLSYSKPYIFIDLEDGSFTEMTLMPTGPIINGWQKIEGTFRFNTSSVLPELSRLYIHLKADGEGTVFFDDIRIHPKNATMKSFAYDKSTQRLMAELDENNFATFYEYDKEGGLVRIKKETDRGIYTIKESRSSSIKRDF